MLNKNLNIRNFNKMVVKNNNKMFTKLPPTPPLPSSSSTTTTPPLRSSSSSFLARTEQKSKHVLSSREFLPTPPPVTPTRNKSPFTSEALPFVAVSTTASKSLSVSLPPTQSASLQTTAMADPMDGTATTVVVRASVGASNALVGRSKLLQQQSSRHRQIKQQQQYHHPHHHHLHHHTPQFRFRILPGLKATSFFTILTLVCLETVLLSTVSNCAKTFYMHWNTSNSIFRIDNTDHIIDVNKGNLAFEFDQVHIICPVYEPGTFENETEKYIIYNVSKVEYETCRITNADPRVIAICDKPQKLMFFTITFRPFTPQPGGLEFLPGNDYYFISTSSKDDLYRRIGGRCSTNNMKVVFKVCCALEDKNNRTNNNIGGGGGGIGNGGINSGNSGSSNSNTAIQQQHNNNININGGGGGGGGQLPSPKLPGMGGGMNNGNSGINNGGGLMINGNSGTSINTNIDQFNRIPMQQPNNINGNGGIGMGNGNMGMNGIGLNGGGVNGQHPTGIRVNNVPSSQQHPSQKNGMHGGFIAPMANINTNSSNVVQSTISWPDWGNHNNHNGDHSGGNGNGGGGNPPDQNGTPVSTIGIHPHFYPPHLTSPRPNINSAVNDSSIYSPSHKPTKKTNDYDKHPNEVVKNEELTYNSAASAFYKITRRRRSGIAGWISSDSKLTPRRSLRFNKSTPYTGIYQKFKSLLQLLLFTSNHRNRMNTINTFINFFYNCNPIIITTTVLVTISNLFQNKLLPSWNKRCHYSNSSKVPPTLESTSPSTIITKTRTSKLRLKLSSLPLNDKQPILSPVDCITEAPLSKLLNIASSER